VRSGEFTSTAASDFEVAHPEISVERLMRQIREDAERKRQGLPIGRSTATAHRAAAFHLPRLPETAGELPRKSRYALSELLDRYDEDFLCTAYQAILDRRPDASGQHTYLGGLRAGRLSKIDILGRLRFSPEGRERKITVRGLLPVWLAHTAYRIPVLGALLAWLSALMRLPRLVRQWNHFENFVMFQYGQQNVQINMALTQLETELRQTRQRLAACEAQLQQGEIPPNSHGDGVDTPGHETYFHGNPPFSKRGTPDRSTSGGKG
jgi:O-antigen chain-terminating methyltransferase